MARINLLPWRQEERLRKNKEFNAVLGAAAIVAALGVGMVYMFFNGQLEAQQQANAMIEAENTRLDKVNEEISALEQQREEMLARMKLIQDLQGKRSVPVRVWDDIARAVPSAMYLTKMSRVGDTLTIEGYADNANVVSQLVRNLDASPWLNDTRIPMIQSKIEAYQSTVNKPKDQDGQDRAVYPEDNYIRFTVTTQVVYEQKPADGQGQEGQNAPTDPNQAVPLNTTDPNQPVDPNAPTAPVAGQVVDPVAPPSPTGVPAPTGTAPAQQPAGLPAPTEPTVPQQPASAPVPAPATSEPQPVPQPQASAGGQ